MCEDLSSLWISTGLLVMLAGTRELDLLSTELVLTVVVGCVLALDAIKIRLGLGGRSGRGYLSLSLHSLLLGFCLDLIWRRLLQRRSFGLLLLLLLAARAAAATGRARSVTIASSTSVASTSTSTPTPTSSSTILLELVTAIAPVVPVLSIRIGVIVMVALALEVAPVATSSIGVTEAGAGWRFRLDGSIKDTLGLLIDVLLLTLNNQVLVVELRLIFHFDELLGSVFVLKLDKDGAFECAILLATEAHTTHAVRLEEFLNFESRLVMLLAESLGINAASDTVTCKQLVVRNSVHGEFAVQRLLAEDLVLIVDLKKGTAFDSIDNSAEWLEVAHALECVK